MIIGIIPAILISLILLIPVMVGVYVYKDAKKRGMNAVLWTLIVLLTPFLIGLVIYLLVRGNYPDLRCPQCGEPIREKYISCPSCGAKLKKTCPSCASPVEPQWKVCPYCAQSLPEYSDAETPVQNKDDTLWKILTAIVLVPIIALLILVFSITVFTGSGSSSMTTMSAQHYLELMGKPKIEAWYENVDQDPHKAQVLLYEEEQGDQLHAEYLIYFSQLAEEMSSQLGIESGLNGDTFHIKFYNAHSSQGSTIALASFDGEKLPELKLTYEDETLDCEIQKVDFMLYPRRKVPDKESISPEAADSLEVSREASGER